MNDSLRNVFPALTAEEPVSEEILDNTSVTGLRYTSDKKHIIADIVFRRLIGKDFVRLLEKRINEKCLSHDGPRLLIAERYDLPWEYHLSDLVTLYRDSMILEFSEEHPSMGGVLKRSVWEASDDDRHLFITLDKQGMAMALSEQWKKEIRDCFRTRFSYETEAVFRFEELSADFPKEERAIPAYAAKPEKEAAVSEEIAAREEDRTPESLPENPAAPAEYKKAAPAGTEKPTFERADKAALNPPKGKKRGKVLSAKAPEKDPNVLYGRAFTDESKPLSSYEPNDECIMVLRCEIISVDVRPLKNGEKSIMTFSVTDYTDSIRLKLFVRNDAVKELSDALFVGRTILVKGQAEYDPYEHELTLSHVFGILRYDLPIRTLREDRAPVKRVELHAHSRFSENDALPSPKEMLSLARRFGHKALAITDHGNVQAFPDFFLALNGDPDFKVLYGMEGYLVDDDRIGIVHPRPIPLDAPAVVFDLETTGFSAKKCRIIEIGAVKIENGEIIDRFSSFVNPEMKLPYRIEELTGILNQDLLKAPTIEQVLPEFLSFISGAYLVAHNADFDVSFILENMKQLFPDRPTDFTYVDTVAVSRALLPKLSHFKLDQVAKELDVELVHHHRAVDDAECTAKIWIKLMKRLSDRNVKTLSDIPSVVQPTEDMIRKMPTHHVVIFATSEEGRVNLYRTVSDSHLKYFMRKPRIPRSLLKARREGLLIGSACSAGELFDALLRGASDESLQRIVSFYDYLEIQPLGNNRYLIDDPDYDFINSDEDLKELNRKILALGDLYDKPVVATGDVHFLEPEDAVYREILQAGTGFDENEEHRPPLYFRTTEEMLQEFDYLGGDRSYEVVVKNTNLIADRIGTISPLREDKCPPVIKGADEDLRNNALKRAKALYGDPLPPVVLSRLNRELDSIINNGYAVMYAIAHNLIRKSMSDGYLVGSRGSVGSSLAATMYDITEVNPLPPHYRCPNCLYTDFDSETVKRYADNTGWDMPDKTCPKCGKTLVKDGFNIPFETFLGFEGEKEPDIDLNFSGEYQAKAHAYTEVIFGEGQTYKAGTVQTVKDKTSIGFVMHYLDERHKTKRSCEVQRIAKHIEGVKRSTGQHPGGIVVLPIGEDINTFTPVQHPANDMNSSIVTTQFDYHKIESNLLKLDILGHDDPTMIRMLYDLIGVDPRTFPLDSPEVMSLFNGTEALGITPEDISGTSVGVLGIPEFGTDNAISMLLECKPKYVSDLLRISGLAHGTNVWHGNAEVLIKDGRATIQTAVCTRDDIMMYLISKGMEPSESFNIMEAVRKGKVAKHDEKTMPKWKVWREHMEGAGVPDWYIWSCEHIEYMFPKAHAAAYVMMALRIAYAKVFYPLQYYCAYFSIRADGFDYATMAMGREKMEHELRRLKGTENLSNIEALRYRDIRIVEEMYARGFSFVPIDLYKVQSTRFTIVSERELMPSLVTIDGMGEVAADTLVEAAKKGPFTSLQDLRNKTKLTKTLIDRLCEMEVLSGLPKDDQISFADLFGAAPF